MSATLGGDSKHSAPGQYLGFALQPVRLFFHLIKAPPGTRVSLEYLDDVAVHYSNGAHLVEQTKSALAHNPLSDWSVDLWKTIANWIDALKTGVLDVQRTTFRLYVVPLKKQGKWSHAIHVADTKAATEELTKTIRKKLAERPEPPTCLPYLQFFLDATEEERFELVRRIQIVNLVDDPIEEIYELLSVTIPVNLLDVVCHAGIGMAKERADKLIRAGRPAIIGSDEFRIAFHAFVQKNNIPGYLSSMQSAPDDLALKKVWLGKPDFVRQLEFINLPDDQQLRAVSDLLRTSADKAFWAESGIVFQGSFDDWDRTLIQQHNAVESEVHDLFSHKSEEVQGRLVYSRCVALQIPFDGRAVPGHFAHGSFNALSEERLLGWHPRYLDKFGEDE